MFILRGPMAWFVAVVAVSVSILGGASAEGTAEVPLSDVLVIRSVARAGRSVVHLDPVEARIVSGQWRPPVPGEVLSTAGGEQRWEAAKASEKGVLPGARTRGGYVYWPIASDREQVMVLEAAGSSCVYVNGEIRAGDVYGFGYLKLPVLLHPGTNEFLFQSGRGDLRAKLIAPPAPLSIHTADSTLPDIILGEREQLWGAVVLLNATTNTMRASLRVLERGGPESSVNIPPLGIYKAPFVFLPPRIPKTNQVAVTLEAMDRSGRTQAPARAKVNLRVREPKQTHVRTFISDIDGSVQYYAVNPASLEPRTGSRPALFLSLHGAGVEARGQAESYHPKSWGHIVCPTNRRPYGFDWEEWGRWDALEVLAAAKARYQPDPSRIYLTGHSMGGHGTWQLGVLFPDQFAAIGPSAGWVSFSSYVGRGAAPVTNAVQQLLRRAAAASETLLMATNYLQQGVYLLHGDADDNVPVSEAREMRRVLGEFHRDFDFHEQPGAGHWWDASDEPGTDCVDWAPMFDFFARRAIPSDRNVRRVQFVTVNPAVSSRSHWASILAQQRNLEPSAIDLRCDPGKRRIVGVTTNVARLGLEFPNIEPGSGLTIELDGQKLQNVLLPKPKDVHPIGSSAREAAPGLMLVRGTGQEWRVEPSLPPSHKHPGRSGPFRQAFRNHMVLVYATQGTAQENAWTLTKARYDAEAFYYRGNASIELLADVDAVAQRRARKQGLNTSASRNVILYGHADCNAAWKPLLGHSPVQVNRGHVRVGDRELAGEGFGCLFLQPHPQDDGALVGAVAGSGMQGFRVTERLPYFLAGAGIPDCLVISADLPAEGINGVVAAGFFGQDWQVTTGEFAWRQ